MNTAEHLCLKEKKQPAEAALYRIIFRECALSGAGYFFIVLTRCGGKSPTQKQPARQKILRLLQLLRQIHYNGVFCCRFKPMRRSSWFVKHAQKVWRKAYMPSATLPAHTIDCPECGLRTRIPKLRQGQRAECPRCHHHLVRVENEPFLLPLACASAALMLMFLVYSLPFVTVQMTGVFSPLTLPGMLQSLLHGDWAFLGTVMFLLTFGTPAVFLCACIWVYGALLWQKQPASVLWLTRWLVRLREWIMVDVFFISMLVAYIKIRTVATVEFGQAFWLMPVWAVLLLRTAVAVPSHWVYYQIRRRSHELLHDGPHHICCSCCLFFRPADESRCGVCDSELFDRRPYSLHVAGCFLLAAIVLYFPANLLPIMISENPISKEVSTIMSGILYMWNDGDKLIASIIFSASIAVPTLKIVSMLVLLANARFGLFLPIRVLSLQYRITEAVGRWSMIDIFVIIIMMSAFHSHIARVTPGPAAIYFCLVVILTMLSAHFFDVRLLWDKYREDAAPPESIIRPTTEQTS